MYKSLYEQLPSEFQKIAEFKAITEAEFKELEKVEKGTEKVRDENFIDLASEWGIKKYEEQFNIKADPTLEDLDFRKWRLKSRKMDKVPFTHRWLENKLINLFGENNYSLEIDNNKYTLYLKIETLDFNQFHELLKSFREVKPCNIVLHSSQVQKLKTSLSIATTGRNIKRKIILKPRVEDKIKLNTSLYINDQSKRIKKENFHPRREEEIRINSELNVNEGVSKTIKIMNKPNKENINKIALESYINPKNKKQRVHIFKPR